MKHLCYGLNDFSYSSKEIVSFEGAKEHKQTVKQSEISPVFAIGTPKISGTTLDEVAQCLLFITHPQYHPLGQGRLW